MPLPIENPGQPEDYIDGLRFLDDKKYANLCDEPDILPPTVTPSGNPTRRQSRVDVRIAGPVRCLIGAAVFVAGVATGAMLIASANENNQASRYPSHLLPTDTPSRQYPAERQTQPAPKPEPSVVFALTPECRLALDGMIRHLDAAVAISSVNQQQLDIMAEAYQAIFLKDWKKLNDLAGRQRELDRKLSTDRAELLPKSNKLREDLEACHSQQD